MPPRILRMRQTTQAPRILVGIRVEDIVQHASFVRPVAQYVTGDRMSPEGRANLNDNRTVLPRTDQFRVKSIAGPNQRLALRKIKHLVQLHLVDFSPRPFVETRTEDACDINGLHLINPLMRLCAIIISNPSHLPQTNAALSRKRSVNTVLPTLSDRNRRMLAGADGGRAYDSTLASLVEKARGCDIDFLRCSFRLFPFQPHDGEMPAPKIGSLPGFFDRSIRPEPPSAPARIRIDIQLSVSCS